MDKKDAIYGPFFGVFGASAGMILSAFGAAYGTWKAGSAISAATVIAPHVIMKTLIPVVMSSIIAIYGLIASILIIDGIKPSVEGYTMYTGFLHLGSGLTVGVTGLGAGYALGIAGEAGVRAVAQESSIYVGFLLILIFAEVLGLYGLIVALILTTKII
ncbi:V-type proton ATPase 16 kDa proteolipid subunit c-like [Uloborus diversus]|uniref:V-type proton ATPase 16 kDa proteolipid subunit c-like n=1 Tax=Uloborus diversus TaxID=327109 RepID=UPI002409D2DD|nr:V-type proton ATPase 16 kDa proteolipid subunit c-like [Uloborus diversus]